MKKILIIGALIICAFVLLFLFISKKDHSVMEDYYKNQVSFEKLQADLLKQDEKIIYFYKPDCKYCKKVSPIVIPLAQEMKIPLEVMNIEKYPQSWETFEIQGTPTIIHYKNGKELDRILGAHDKSKFKEWFEKIQKVN
ncbi:MULTISPECIES: thioredoxin family protein [Bacillus cereus group]|uniref:Thiol reductase thioredoxin n=1 Tax=Bacillus thuringiensis TaxID=1428 RepID=A0A9X7AQS2_BACTU|nr:thioredoxin family protein [Bacillus thuringiensis]MCQ6334967.1 thioredoxin family protein [Bacillus cereus]PFT49190.1 thiol reductase thioredoxin [Bacillus thuringiensis]